SRQNHLQGAGSRFRNATRREPAQARYQGHRAQTRRRQQQEKPRAWDDRGNPGSQNKGEPVTTTPKAIEVVNIVKRYGNFTTIDGVSFDVAEGEVFGLLGPNGAGKSTLIRMMTTLLDITGGTARIEGFDVRKDPDRARRSMGVIPQAMTSDGDLTVWENLSIYSKLYGIPASDREKS